VEKITTLRPSEDRIIAPSAALVFGEENGRPVARRYVVGARNILGSRLIDATAIVPRAEVLQLPLDSRTALNFALRYFADLSGREPERLAERRSAPRVV
jgi:hypothetical protein